MKVLSALLFFFIPALCYGQSFIGKKKARVKQHMIDYAKKGNIENQQFETDSSFTFKVSDEDYKSIEFTFIFNRKKRCVKEIRVGCDTCIRKYLNEALETSKYDWKEVKSGLYVSKPFWHLMMEVAFLNENQLKLTITKTGNTTQEHKAAIQVQ